VRDDLVCPPSLNVKGDGIFGDYSTTGGIGVNGYARYLLLKCPGQVLDLHEHVTVQSGPQIRYSRTENAVENCPCTPTAVL